MCDMTQFVEIVPVPNETSTTLANNFMQYVLLKFGICHLIVLYDSSLFKDIFSAMYKALNINFDILASRNHKGLQICHDCSRR